MKWNDIVVVSGWTTYKAVILSNQREVHNWEYKHVLVRQAKWWTKVVQIVHIFNSNFLSFASILEVLHFLNCVGVVVPHPVVSKICFFDTTTHHMLPHSFFIGYGCLVMVIELSRVQFGLKSWTTGVYLFLDWNFHFY